MNEDLQTLQRRYYNFPVRYEEVLNLDTTYAPERAEAVILTEIETGKRGAGCHHCSPEN